MKITTVLCDVMPFSQTYILKFLLLFLRVSSELRYVCPVTFRTLYAISWIENSFLLDLTLFINFTKYVVI